MEWVDDKTGRFGKRPHYTPIELDRECEQLISDFLLRRYGMVKFPISTEDLTVMIEQIGADLDMYVDLSAEGTDVEGLTEFSSGQLPLVKISKRLAADPSLENRLRTTLTHECAHVYFHRFLWDLKQANGDLYQQNARDRSVCKRESVLNANYSDWMEWQAGYSCGAMLMPASAVKRLVVDILHAKQCFSASVAIGSSVGQQLIHIVADSFQVSSDAARVRLLKLKFLQEGGENQSHLWA